MVTTALHKGKKMYSWTILDVFSLLGIKTSPHKEEVIVPCPFCNGKRFAMNQRISAGHCFNCEQAADSASYYAQTMGLSIEEARRDIERRLNIGSTVSESERPQRIVYTAQKQEEMAKINDLDFTYRSFLAELTLSEKNKNMLLARGFNEKDIVALGYKTFPNKSDVDFFAICRRLQANGCKLRGVPGFFQTKRGDWTFISVTQGIILPQKTVNNQIFGLQIRKDDDLRVYKEETGELEEKCVWFSSKNCRSGCSARADINFSCDFKFDAKTKKYWIYAKTKKIILTEGSMKADLIHAFEPDLPVISVAGVNSTTYLEQTLKYLKKLGIETIVHAYDMDYKTNDKVQKQLEKTRKIIKDAGFEYKMMEWDTEVSIDGQSHELLKGLDDYMAYHKKGIIPRLKNLE